MTPTSDIQTELERALKELQTLRKLSASPPPARIVIGRKTQVAIALSALGCWYTGGPLGMLTCLLLGAAYAVRGLWTLPEAPLSPQQLPRLAAQIREVERRIEELTRALTLEEKLL